MQKELWRNRWLSCINELTSLELQRKSWLDKSNTNPHWSFVEFMCSYFDDLVIDNNYKDLLNEGWISKREFEIIQSWHGLLDKYDSPNNEDHDVEAILADKKWQRIVEEGKKAKSELSRLLSKDENQILNEKIDYTKYM
ncbi:hypothetical protein SAMN05444285_16211 [Draconibacterium orientale]|uniref:Uncharacterized protein n=1 Tax=Draconibacterium orientale TaxID=1168034 RepID=X5DNW8_9BACT|nr:hypothetical protein [Draconibacterium orientale]AHW62337.1 hypothetical protein FH5T_19845 [Draconibacterium orientale]SEU15840.1 hypothetical protein SAMN05444285_16211 [Draconibacterium orientale]